jgi:hypothetical protein
MAAPVNAFEVRAVVATVVVVAVVVVVLVEGDVGLDLLPPHAGSQAARASAMAGMTAPGRTKSDAFTYRISARTSQVIS